MTMHEMAERIAEVEELERLRVENRRLRAELHRVKRDEEFRQQMLLMQAMRPMTKAEMCRYAANAMQARHVALPQTIVDHTRGETRPSLFGPILGTTWL